MLPYSSKLEWSLLTFTSAIVEYLLAMTRSLPLEWSPVIGSILKALSHTPALSDTLAYNGNGNIKVLKSFIVQALAQKKKTFYGGN
jgi:hypothetical protein